MKITTAEKLLGVCVLGEAPRDAFKHEYGPGELNKSNLSPWLNKYFPGPMRQEQKSAGSTGVIINLSI